MLRVPIQQAKTGMILARSVINPKKPEHTLLKAGFELDTEHINRLKQLNVRRVWVQYPGLDFLDELLDPELINQQQELYKTLKEQFTEAQEHGLDKIDYNEYVKQMSQLFRRLLKDQNRSSLFVTELQGESHDIFMHGTTVASLALLIGLRLESYLVKMRSTLPATLATDLTYLGVGCLLHDIGKLYLPEELQNFRMTAQDTGSAEWQKHTEIGFKMIKNGLDAVAGQVILNHHQHFDGSGFPARKPLPGLDEPVMPLQGEEIHIFCRIAAVADRFAGFRHLPDGRYAPTIVALKRIQNPGYARWFDPVVLEAMTSALPPFPPGEQVQLNNGQTVVVMEINEEELCRPIVKEVNLSKAEQPGNQESEEDGREINLLTRRDLYIARVDDFDVSPYVLDMHTC